ncbi:MAG: hypothetical protein ACJAT2_001522 [Bacteriovoracaceae bacterium]
MDQEPMNFLKKIEKEIYIIFFVWLLFYIWRPFVFGFYSDDYDLVSSAANLSFFEKFEFYLKSFSTRPMSIVFASVFSIFFKNNHVLWQWGLALFSLLTAFLLNKVLHKIALIKGETKDLLPAMITCLWLVLPSNFGFNAWPTFLFHLPALTFFLLSFYTLIKDTEVSLKNILVSVTFFTVSVFTYEAFYFLFIIPIGYLWIYRSKFNLGKNSFIKITFLFSFIQIIAILQNRIAKTGTKKSFHFDLIVNKLKSIINSPSNLISFYLPLLAIGLLIFISFKIYKAVKENRSTKDDYLSLFLLKIGFLASIVLYYAAGYAIQLTGTFSRTTFSLSILLCFMLLHYFSIFQFKKLKLISMVILVLCGGITLKVSSQWKASWDLQQDILSKVPYKKLENIEDALVVAIVPNNFGPVVVFDEEWSMTPAVRHKYPEAKIKGLFFLPHRNNKKSGFNSVFEKSLFIYVDKIHHKQNIIYKRKHYFLWNYFSGKLYRVIGDLKISSGADWRKITSESLLEL